MKQTEYEQKLVELKNEDCELINDYKMQVQQTNEEIAELNKMVLRIRGNIQACKQKRTALTAMVAKLEARRGEKIAKFKKENYTEERKLSEVSDWCLVNELRARGFYGTIENSGKPEDFMQNLQARFRCDDNIGGGKSE